MMKGLLQGERVLFLLFIVFFPLTMTSRAEEEAKYPSRPITFIQPFTAGGSVDLAVRLISKEAEKYLGQPIVLVNKPGGAGSIGVAAIATAKRDGYTIGNAPQDPMILVPYLEKVPYHPVKDLQMIMQFGGFNGGIIVKSDSPFKSLKDLIAFADQNPKKLTYGTSGVNSLTTIVMEQIAKKEKVQLTRIPFKATVESQTALMGGHILFAAGGIIYSTVESGQVRVILLFTEGRSAEYPQVPTLKEMGYGSLVPPVFVDVAGPKGIPAGILKKLEDAFTKAMKEPAFIKGMKDDLRFPIVYRNSKELTEYVAQSYENYGKVLKDMGVIK